MMSDGALLRSPESPAISSPLYQSGTPDEGYSLHDLDGVESARDGPSRETLLGPAEPEDYDQEEARILIAPQDSLERPTDGNGVVWTFDNRRHKSKSTLQAVLKWIKGPQPPRVYHIQSSEWLQNVCDRLLDRILPGRWLKLLALLALNVVWIGVFLVALPKSVISSTDSVDGQPIRLDCTSRLWPNSTACGLNGQECRPFEDNHLAFVCPAGCKDVMLLEPHFIGSQQVNYRSLVVGGPQRLEDPASAIYRGDSFICAAAIHAGVTTNSRGGCGDLLRTGEQSNFPSVDAHGILSIGFPSNFPLSFTFNSSSLSTAACRDSRWMFLGTSTLITSILSVFVTSAAAFFWSVFVGVFFHVALISDPPYYQDYADVVSMAFRRFLPAAFVGHVIYQFCVRRTLSDLKAPIERTVLWLGGCWVGALNNVTFDRIPISRLTPHDLQQQPGAILALSLLVGIILVIAVGQAWCFRTEGRVPRYLVFYGVVGALLVALVLIPGMNLRIHHYILALILLPGTSLQTRPSLLYQGILVGLFLNGVARWGFDSILQTPGQLLQDGALGSLVPALSRAPVIVGANITFTFDGDLAVSPPFDGIGVLVNDVLRFQAFKPEEMTFPWTRRAVDEPEFFRFAYVKRLEFGGGEWYGDFTPPALWDGNGTWVAGVD
ncbi:LCCL domain-containing protein isoform 2 [Cladophialophora immunda]|nr:LCCL domain-containing protein isoform 1 [Cladophialophora immunda]OQU93929.1 LCCL domain-containing protein isoform 2 [Cladophialophora immunda]